MLELRPSLAAACLAAALLAAPAAMALEVGKPAPAYALQGPDGLLFDAAGARGDVIVLNLWATWCTYCREEMPALERYYRRHQGEGLRLVAVSMDDADADARVREIMGAYSYPAALGRLSDLSGFGRIWRLPMTFVIDRDGVLRRDGGEGDPKVDLATLEREVTPLLAR